ncbi:conjugative transposon protein TraM, partial [Alistipes putredinis]|uniref:conjugative transposon protein TraM n=1 Tax=Alistipes putredinis TaxID=28117 RepID=UPI003966CA78
MTLLCGIFLWYLFAPKPAPQQAGTGGYNVTIPEATVKPAETDKRKVYEQEQYEQQRREKLQSLGDVMDDRLPVTGEMADATVPAAPTAIDESDAAYRRISGEMAAFYTPAPSCGNTEVEALKEQVAALQSQLDAERQQPDPLELAEEQYKLARKYLGGGTAADEEAGPTKQRRDSRLSVMRPVREGEVEASTLDPRADFTVERNLGFLTAAGDVAHADIPTVRACVAQTQIIRAGSTVQLRLLEAVRIDGVTIPRYTPLYGLATISGMRLQVTVSSVEYGGRIFAVEAVAYDLDGQPGLNVPNSRERTALKEALASVGQTAGTSVNVTRSAGQQVLSELARGGLQASSQYVAGKLREVK